MNFLIQCLVTHILSASQKHTSSSEPLSEIYTSNYHYRAAFKYGSDRLQCAARRGEVLNSEISQKLWRLIARLVWDIDYAEHFECWYHSPLLDRDGPAVCHFYAMGHGFERWNLASTRFQAMKIMFEGWRALPMKPEFMLVEFDLAEVLKSYCPNQFKPASWTMDWETRSRIRYRWDSSSGSFTEPVLYECTAKPTSKTVAPRLDAKGVWPSMLELAAFFDAKSILRCLIDYYHIPVSMPNNNILWAALLGRRLTVFGMLLDYEHPEICQPNEFGETLLNIFPYVVALPWRKKSSTVSVFDKPDIVRSFLVNGRVIRDLKEPTSIFKAPTSISNMAVKGRVI